MHLCDLIVAELHKRVGVLGPVSVAGFTVLPFYEDYWGGQLTGVSYSSGTGLTTIYGPFGAGIGGVFGPVSVAAGDVIVPNLHQPVALHIDSYSSGSVTVIGDVTAFVAVDDWFRIHIKSHHNYNPDDEDKWVKRTGCEYGARYLWSGYRRVPWTISRAGEDPYHTWNRWYLPGIGRWTSPDPAMTPWENLQDYVLENPLATRDPSGLCDANSDIKPADRRDTSRCYDAPIGGAALTLGGPCKPRIYIRDEYDPSGNSGFEAGIEEGIANRVAWLRSKRVVPTQGDPARVADRLGGWIIRQAAAWPARFSPLPSGHMWAVAIVMVYCCKCDFKMYEQWKDGGSVADNYADAAGNTSDPTQNSPYMSRERGDANPPTNKGTCYRVFVDSPGVFATGRTPLENLKASYSMKVTGRFTVTDPTNSTDHVSTLAKWNVESRARMSGRGAVHARPSGLTVETQDR